MGGIWCWRRGRGTWWRPPPPNPPHQTNPPPVAPKSPGAHFCGCLQGRTGAVVGTGLQEGCARDQPLFAGALHAHMTLDWVFRRLVRCQIRRHGENKGTWRRDNERGGAWTWRPLPGELISPMPEGISVGSLSSLNLCGDPRGVWFGTAHSTWPSSIGSRWDGAASGGRGRGSTLRSSGLLYWPPCASYMTPPRSTSTRGRGAARGTPPPRSPSLPQPPPLRPPTSWRTLWRPQRPPHTFGQRWQLSMCKERRLVLRYVCLFAS